MMVTYLSKIVGFRKQGDDLRKYVNLGIAKQFLNKYNAVDFLFYKTNEFYQSFRYLIELLDEF